MGTIIYNCKRCKTARRIEFPLTEKLHRGYGRYEYRAYRMSEQSYNLGFDRFGPRKERPEDFARCPTCDSMTVYKRIEGFTNLDVPCDGRCTGARGHMCECSCGGKNHGAGWSQIGKPIAEVLKCA